MKYQTVLGAIAFLVLVGYGWKLALVVLILGSVPLYWLMHKLQINHNPQ